MKFFAHGVERNLDVFNDRIAFALGIECLFARSFDRVLQKVEQTADAGCLALLDKLLAAGANKQRLHVASRLRQIEKLATAAAASHFDDPLRLVEANVRERSRGDIYI